MVQVKKEVENLKVPNLKEVILEEAEDLLLLVKIF